MPVAEIDWGGTGDEHFGPCGGAFGGSQLSRHRVDLSHPYARGRLKGLRPSHQQDSLFHELCPDGQGGLGAFQFEVAMIVVADPHHA